MDETRVMPPEGTCIRVRYWAAAKAAAGAAEDCLDTETALTLLAVRDRAVALHPSTRLEDVLAVCSALVDDRPAGSSAPDEVLVEPGATVDFLPPFAGG